MEWEKRKTKSIVIQKSNVESFVHEPTASAKVVNSRMLLVIFNYCFGLGLGRVGALGCRIVGAFDNAVIRGAGDRREQYE